MKRVIALMLGIAAVCGLWDGCSRSDDAAHVADLHRRAAAGEIEAQFELGMCYANGKGVEESLLEADKWYRKAARRGHVQAQYRLGQIFDRGEGIAKDALEAMRWYRMAAEQGHAKAQFNLGVSYYNGEGIAMTEAMKWYCKAAEQGHAGAQRSLSACYAKGKCSGPYKAEAEKWFRRSERALALRKAMSWIVGAFAILLASLGALALLLTFPGRMRRRTMTFLANRGHAFAQYVLGMSCYNGRDGCVVDYAEAVKWLRRAAEQGNARAQCYLGMCYDLGRGVEGNKAAAAEWYRRAAEKGYAEAQFSLGCCYADGCGVERRKGEAVKWWRKAADDGHAKAQFRLGESYATGKGVGQKDVNEAAKWYRKAAEQGHEEAAKALRSLGGT